MPVQLAADSSQKSPRLFSPILSLSAAVFRGNSLVSGPYLPGVFVSVQDVNIQ